MLTGIAIAFAAAAVGSTGADAGPREIQTVAKLLEELGSGEGERIDAAIPASVAVEDNGSGAASGSDLARYAGECPLRQVTLPPAIAAPPDVTVVEVRWACEGRADNEAYFRFVRGVLDRITFRAVPIYRVR